MDWPTWAPLYAGILNEFRYDRATDETARNELDDALAFHQRTDLASLRGPGEAWVLGALADADDLARIPRDARVFVTDAACAIAVPRMRPTAIVTDLDGDIAAQAVANAMGVPVFVHAHGDNREALREHLPAFRGPLVGTTQAKPHGRVQNFGGFTDGDRACCIAVELGADSLALVGFDFDAPLAKDGRDIETKRRKLAWARRIIEALGVPVRRV